jgi:hypothetical protein
MNRLFAEGFAGHSQVQLLVSTFIGMSYGILFRDEASNLAMAGAWGWVSGGIC